MRPRMWATPWARENRKHETHKLSNIFLGPLAGQLSQGRSPPVPGQTGQNGEFSVKISRERPFCPGDGMNLSHGQVPLIPGTGLVCPGHCPAQTVYLYWFFCLSEHQPEQARVVLSRCAHWLDGAVAGSLLSKHSRRLLFPGSFRKTEDAGRCWEVEFSTCFESNEFEHRGKQTHPKPWVDTPPNFVPPCARVFLRKTPVQSSEFVWLTHTTQSNSSLFQSPHFSANMCSVTFMLTTEPCQAVTNWPLRRSMGSKTGPFPPRTLPRRRGSSFAVCNEKEPNSRDAISVDQARLDPQLRDRCSTSPVALFSGCCKLLLYTPFWPAKQAPRASAREGASHFIRGIALCSGYLARFDRKPWDSLW